MTLNSRIDFSSLQDNIVLYIFNLNTDMSQDGEPARKGFTNSDDLHLTEENIGRDMSLFMSLGHQSRSYALTITLRTSQVCRRWRQLLLPATSVWGQLIDLNILSKTNVLLRDTVVRRAGSSSLLSIKGFGILYPSPTFDFVAGLLRQHWARLEYVDIYIKTPGKLSREQTGFWRTIATPAPCLRHFSFVFSNPITTNPHVLTANAPVLKELCTTPSSPLRLSSPWLPNLTFLSVDGVGVPTLQFTLPEFLDALRHILHLDTLRLIHTRIAEKIYGEQRHVQIPSLRKLILEDDFNTCFTVLRLLAPSSKCTLEIRAGHPHAIPVEEYWNLSSSLEQYLKQRTYNDRLLIDLQPRYLSFVDAYPDCYPEPTISIRIEYDPEHDDEYALSFFGELPCGRFKHVKDLWFRINLPNLFGNILDFIPVSDDFHYGLRALEVLKTTTQGFMLFNMASSSLDRDSKTPIPLPRLQRIRIIPPSNAGILDDPDTELGSQFVEEFIDLFKARKRRGMPIKHLDVRECVGDLRKLDCCKDLKVTWLDACYCRDGEPGKYICGSGNRRILNLDY